MDRSYCNLFSLPLLNVGCLLRNVLHFFFLFFFLFLLQKAKGNSDRVASMLKASMTRRSYLIEDTPSNNIPPRRRRCGVFPRGPEQDQLVIEIEKRMKKSPNVSLSDKIDFTSRYLFPVSFILFNVLYWFAYAYDMRVLPENSRGI